MAQLYALPDYSAFFPFVSGTVLAEPILTPKEKRKRDREQAETQRFSQVAFGAMQKAGMRKFLRKKQGFASGLLICR